MRTRAVSPLRRPRSPLRPDGLRRRNTHPSCHPGCQSLDSPRAVATVTARLSTFPATVRSADQPCIPRIGDRHGVPRSLLQAPYVGPPRRRFLAMTGAAHALETVDGLAALARDQHGVVSREQLRALGVTADHVRHQLRARRWARHGQFVVALHTGPLTRPGWAWAAALHSAPYGLITAWTALEARGLQRWRRELIHVAHPRGTTVAPAPWIARHESRRLDLDADRDHTTDLPMVRAARAAVDAACWSDRADHASALILAVVQQRVAAPSDLADELDAAGPVRHRRAIAEAIDLSVAGAESLAEGRVGPILRAAGLPPPRRQTRRLLAGRRSRTDIEVDLPDGSVLVIEVDGPDHEGAQRRALDAVRDLGNLAQGRVTVRVTPWMLVYRRQELIDALVRVRVAAERRAAAVRRG